jgi:AbrB family looped-hinge helix DNA binding protein
VVGISLIRPLGDKGQVVIPKQIREQFHLTSGTRLFFEVRDNKIIITPQHPDTFLDEFCSIVQEKIREPIRIKDL